MCPYQCADCLKRFVSEIKLEKHNKNKHKCCPRFACPKCHLRFCTPGKLETHLSSHTDSEDDASNETMSTNDQTVPSMETRENGTVVMEIPDDMDLYIGDIDDLIEDLDISSVSFSN